MDGSAAARGEADVARLHLRSKRAPAPRVARDPLRDPGPIVKWAGGKSRLLAELIARRPARYRRYFEPFVGGGALFFRLRPRRALLGDSNAELINTYRCVAWNVEDVIRRLARHKKQHGEEHYYAVRARWNDRSKPMSDVARAAAFLYLNKTCYNGLWRVNSSGGFNVPMGRYKDPSIYDPRVLRAASKVLQRADLCAGAFDETIADAGAGDFVYFDPPYHPLTKTSNFTSYTSGSFSEDDQQALADTARRLAKNGVAVMLSNSDTPFIRELYRDFEVDTVECTRAINSKASRRGAVSELIITAGY